jgi:tetratricopeptide (TPR) repeat protein
MTRISLPRSFIILAAGAFVVGALGCSGNSEAAQQLARADTLARVEKKYPEAIATANQVLARDARDAKANRLAGYAYLELGEFAQAYDRLLRAQARTPDDPQVLEDLARLYVVVGKDQDAHDLAVAALARDSTNLTAAVVLAATATTQRDVADALRRLRSAESRFGNDPAPRLALARLQQRLTEPAPAGRLPQQAGNAQPVAAVSYLLSGNRDQARAVLSRQLAQSSSDVAARRLLAEISLAADSPSVAEQLVAPVLATDSTDVEALILRGRALMVQNRLNEAVRDYRRAQAKAPKLAPVYYYLGAALARLKRDDVARALLDSAIDMTRNYPEAVTDLSVIHIRNDIARASISDAERQVRLNPWSLGARRTLGDVLVAASRHAEAIEVFRDAVKLAPDRAEPHYWLGVILVRDTATAEAKKELEEALRLAPDYAAPLAQLVAIDLDESRADVALRRITTQLEVLPQSAALYTLLGRVHALRRDRNASEAAFLKATQLDPKLLEPRIQLAESAINSGKLDIAITHGEAARQIDPTNLKGLVALGLAYQMKGENPKARDAYLQALAVDSTFVAAANNLALLLAESEADVRDALRYAAVALKGAPRDPLIKDTAGWILYRAGRYQDAVTMLEESASILPEQPEVQYHLGMAAQKTGDNATAKKALEKAVASPANFRGKDEARKALALLK